MREGTPRANQPVAGKHITDNRAQWNILPR